MERWRRTPQPIVVCDAHCFPTESALITRLTDDLRLVFGEVQVDSDALDLEAFQAAQLVAVGSTASHALYRQLYLDKARLAELLAPVRYNESIAAAVLQVLVSKGIVDVSGAIAWHQTTLPAVLDAVAALELPPKIQEHREWILGRLRNGVVAASLAVQDRTPLRAAKQDWLWRRRLGYTPYVVASDRVQACLPVALTGLPAVFPNADYVEAFWQLLRKWPCFHELRRNQLE